MRFPKKCGGTRYAELVFLHPTGSTGQVVHSAMSWQETSTHYFLCSGGLGAVFLKSVSGHVTPNLCFCIRWDLRITQCIPLRPGRETSTHYLSCSGDLVRFPKKRTGTRDAELVFWFLVGSVGHAEQCSTSGARNIDALFFLLQWARSGFKKSAPGHVTPNMCFSRHCDLRVTLSIPVRPGHETSTHYFSYSGCPGAVS
jgi:hypothetical protein